MCELDEAGMDQCTGKMVPLQRKPHREPHCDPIPGSVLLWCQAVQSRVFGDLLIKLVGSPQKQIFLISFETDFTQSFCEDLLRKFCKSVSQENVWPPCLLVRVQHLTSWSSCRLLLQARIGLHVPSPLACQSSKYHTMLYLTPKVEGQNATFDNCNFSFTAFSKNQRKVSKKMKKQH